MQASAVNLFALGNGKAQSARDIKPDDLLIAKASHKNFLPAQSSAAEITYAFRLGPSSHEGPPARESAYFPGY